MVLVQVPVGKAAPVTAASPAVLVIMAPQASLRTTQLVRAATSVAAHASHVKTAAWTTKVRVVVVAQLAEIQVAVIVAKLALLLTLGSEGRRY